MLKNKKMMISVAIIAILIMSFAGTALADNTPYNTGSLMDTGQTYNTISSDSNTKTLAGVSWKIKCTNIDGSRGAGISFQPHYKVGVYYYPQGGSIWISDEVDYTYVSCGTMTCRTYYLRARIDDDWAGPMDAQGKWNAN